MSLCARAAKAGRMTMLRVMAPVALSAVALWAHSPAGAEEAAFVIPADPPAELSFGAPQAASDVRADGPAAAPAPPAAVPAAPTLAQRIRDALSSAAKDDRDSFSRGQTPIADLRREREAVAAFYAARDFAPLWVADGAWTAKARAAMARLKRADEDGLDLSQYPLRGIEADAAAAEIALSEAVVGYGRQASGGRIDPKTISNLITARPPVAEAADILAAVSGADDADAALAAFNPPHPGYRALREKLEEARRARPAVAQRISPGPTLRVGMKDPRVPLIRARFGIDARADADAPSANLVYDRRLASAVADFQRSQRLPANGLLTARTVSALSAGVPENLEAELLANMERWRWAPRDLGETRIVVNIPDFQMALMRGEKVLHRARVIVGKPETQTPVFSDEMEYLVVNPSWNVPPSIVRKEMLPAWRRDPTYFTRRGYEVIERKGQVFVRQPPGERNALGLIKFMFPNEHSVYLHDTPNRKLFSASRRAFSHGCVRVDKPFQLAEALMSEGWSEKRLRGLLGRRERTLRLPERLPVHLQYFTAFVDEAGKLQLRKDLYGHSHKVQAALGL